MIRPPQRAVTRFFVPLIDVLILLFCIFLLMPFVSGPAESGTATGGKENVEELKKKLLETELKLEQARRKLETLEKVKVHPSSAFMVHLLEIDAQDGKLLDFDPESPGGRVEVRDEADARRLVVRLKKVSGGKELHLLILYPRKLSGYPTRKQIDDYGRWFPDVSVGFDNPWESR